MTAWMVRAGRKGILIDDFLDRGVAAIGWNELGGVREGENIDGLRDRVAAIWPSWHPQKVIMAAGQVYRFAKVIQPGDMIVTYDPSSRRYHIGIAKGNYRVNPDADHESTGNEIDVDWNNDVPRDGLSERTKNSLGSISTLFKIPDHAIKDLKRAASGEAVSPDIPDSASSDINAGVDADIDFTLGSVEDRASELIADKLSQLSWEEMQDLVAGILRGMGYKTQISPRGADRGRDILASPDGFGFKDPRIVVEVKHRRNTKMGAPEIRAFLGGRQDGDKCLYVSTGGFTNEARYEADRARYPLKLMSLDDIAEAIQDNYDNLDSATKTLIPLTRVYWPS